jgi:hypothetical protein
MNCLKSLQISSGVFARIIAPFSIHLMRAAAFASQSHLIDSASFADSAEPRA